MSSLPFDDEPVAPAPPAPPAPQRQVLTVSELSATIRGLLEHEFTNVWVEGEISNARVWNSGHLYFTLKDSASQIKGMMFRSTLRLLKFKPEDGLRVIARGNITVYEPKGEYQLLCEHLEPQGFGPLQLAFEQLKKKLQAEGLFEAARKRALPALPRRIGLVTSIDGAALRDMVRVLRRRYPNAHLVIAATRVQGEGAAREIARALELIGRVDFVDVIIVGRGGGSLEDLWAFNEEVVARAIAASPVPVISGVGHETDVTIADFVADLRAATPSAAAELVVRRKDEFFAHIDRLGDRLESAVHDRVRRLESRLHALEARPHERVRHHLDVEIEQDAHEAVAAHRQREQLGVLRARTGEDAPIGEHQADRANGRAERPVGHRPAVSVHRERAGHAEVAVRLHDRRRPADRIEGFDDLIPACARVNAERLSGTIRLAAVDLEAYRRAVARQTLAAHRMTRRAHDQGPLAGRGLLQFVPQAGEDRRLGIVLDYPVTEYRRR